MTSFSQTAPAIEWQNTIGGSGSEQFNSIRQTADGGYILGGWSNSNISGDKTENCIGGGPYGDYWIIKTDAFGFIQWQNTIGGNGNDYLYTIEQTSDGGYILGGYSFSGISGDKTEGNIGDGDYWIVKTDPSGNIQWQNTVGGNSEDELYSVQQTSDGGYILGGWSQSHISGDKTEDLIGGSDYWIVKTDSLGNIQWQNTIGGNDFDWFYSIKQTSDGGYILGGNSKSNISGDKTENCIGGGPYGDYWIIKTDAFGFIQWQNTIGGNDNEELSSVFQTLDGGYMIAGFSWSNISGDKTENCNGNRDYWIVKTDASGNIQWQNTIGGSYANLLYSLQQTSDGGYILGGFSYSNISGDKTENNLDSTSQTADYWIVKTDVSGNIQWDNTIGGIDDDRLFSIQQTSDGGYILGGYSRSNISGDKTENNWDTICNPFCTPDYWIIKLFPDTITGIPNFQHSTFNLQFFPNPLTTQSTLTFSNPRNEKFIFTLYDITGRMCEISPLERGKGCVIT
ncbi:MAG: T9SS C-terminal target domain-containing protein, partial [Bacteroidia bacterium]